VDALNLGGAGAVCTVGASRNQADLASYLEEWSMGYRRANTTVAGTFFTTLQMDLQEHTPR
jgi:hypothetical protein